MDDLGWTLVGVVLLVVACAIAGWGAFELRDPPEVAVVAVPEEPPAPRAPELSAADVDRFYATAYTVACSLDGEAANSPGGAYRLDPTGVDPGLFAVASSLSHDASVDGGKVMFLAPPGATRATLQLDDYGELLAVWAGPTAPGPDAAPTPCASITTVARAVEIRGRVLDPRGSDVVADCAIRRAHVEDAPPGYAIDVPMGRACRLQLVAADGRSVGPPHEIRAAAPMTVDLP